MPIKRIRYELFDNTFIPMRLRMSLLDVGIDDFFSERFCDYTKILILPTGAKHSVKTLKCFLTVLNDFFSTNHAYKFMKYYVQVEVNSQSNIVSVEMLPMIEAA